MPWYVYIAQAKTKRYYVGITTDPERRIIAHNIGNGSQFAKEQGPLTMTYVSVPFPNKSIARKREVQIKKWSREKKERLISGEWT